jgi:hypothetical protein
MTVEDGVVFVLFDRIDAVLAADLDRAPCACSARTRSTRNFSK